MSLGYAEDLKQGAVWLVGAGPGDPGLLTLRAAAALQAADSIFHDALPGREVLVLANPRARLVDVGKRKGNSPWRQSDINEALVAAARRGERVVRLKGGDPLVFGRAGEEIAALAEAGIPWRIVPGVSAATAAPAVAGIPLTMRGMASAVTYLTCHDRDGRLPDNIDALCRADGTLVAFMALTRIDELAIRLLAAGRDPATPVAVVSRAALPGERILRTTLAACTLAIARADMPRPGVIIIGAVAGLDFPNTALAAVATAPAQETINARL